MNGWLLSRSIGMQVRVLPPEHEASGKKFPEAFCFHGYFTENLNSGNERVAVIPKHRDAGSSPIAGA